MSMRQGDILEIKLNNGSVLKDCIAFDFGGKFVNVYFNNEKHNIKYENVDYVKKVRTGEYIICDDEGNITKSTVNYNWGYNYQSIYDDEYSNYSHYDRDDEYPSW